jgi:ABC-type antimicrobial peptide transport system permease subunit
VLECKAPWHPCTLAPWHIGTSTPSIWRSAGHICRDAWRSLRSAPGVTAFIVVVLTLGISAATAGSRPAEVRLVEDAFRNITADRRFNAGLMAIFGALALLIGAAGIYGVMSSVVAQQTRELGVRVALGVYVVVAGVLLVVGLAAALIPALRAVHVDPLVTLRTE